MKKKLVLGPVETPKPQCVSTRAVKGKIRCERGEDHGVTETGIDHAGRNTRGAWFFWDSLGTRPRQSDAE